MLPPALKSAYGQYKQDTDSVASWLASTAEACGFINLPHDSATQRKTATGRPKGKARKKQQNPDAPPASSASAASKPKYTVATRNYVLMAEWIASRTPPIPVPAVFGATIERVIRTRAGFGERMAEYSKEVDAASDERHNYFVGILEKVRDVLKPLMMAPSPPANNTATQPDGPDRLASRFEGLRVYEPLADTSDAVPVERPRPNPAATMTYEAEPQTSDEDAFTAYGMMVNDLLRIRARIRWIWSNYKDGFFDASAAAIGTNAAVDLARTIIDEVMPVLKGHPVWKFVQMFFLGACMDKGFTPQQAFDQVTYVAYDVADDLFVTVFNLLRSLKDVLNPRSLPLYKDGTFGTYVPSQDRTTMTGKQKIAEDQILLFEIFTELVTVNRMVGDYPVQDELMRGFKEMDKTGEIPFFLVFSAQVFLDIHHELRTEADRPFQEMTRQLELMGKTIDETLEFHKGLKFDNWSDNNNMVLQVIRQRMQWIERDPVYKVKSKYFAQQGAPMASTTPRNRILRNSPVLAGLMLFHFRAHLNDIGITLANAFGSVVYTWQLYHALQNEKLLQMNWDDMDVVYANLGGSNFHYGDAPKNSDEYNKKFCLQMGVSVAAFANPNKRRQKTTIASRSGPRGIKEDGVAPVSRAFVNRYVKNSQQMDWTPEHLDQIVSGSQFEHQGSVAEGTLQMELKHAQQRAKTQKKPSEGGQLDPSALIEALVLSLQAETVVFAYPYMVLHRTCWQLLRDVKQRCNTLLVEKFTPDYMLRESELPWVVGWLFWAANGMSEGAGPLRVRDMRLLQQAAEVFDKFLVTDSDRILRLMGEEMGIPVEVRGDSDDSDDDSDE